jgi:superfamily II DNA or RNA helicase
MVGRCVELITVTLNEVLKVRCDDMDLGRVIESDLTMPNPAFTRKKSMGIPTWGEPARIILWKKEFIDNGEYEYTLPRGYWDKLRTRLARWEIEFKPVEDRNLELDIEYPRVPDLRDYQRDAVNSAKAAKQGCIIAPCGAGKTRIGMTIAAELKQPTLWITHTLDLLNQAKRVAEEVLGLSGCEIGVIQGDKMFIGTHMTFATVQTLSARDLTSIKQRFGCVIVDECHLAYADNKKARMFESVINQMPAMYRFGLTASEHRSDGLIETMFHVIGPKLFEVTQTQMNATGNTVVPMVRFITTDFRYAQPDGEMFNLKKVLEAMREDWGREEVIRNMLSTNLHDGDYALVLGDSLDHLRTWHGFVNAEIMPGRAVFIHGGTPKREREAALEGMRSGRYGCLMATKQLAKLGLDIPQLDKLFYLTPHRDPVTTQQAAGRIMRPHPGKRMPVIYDLWDRGVKQLHYWARARAKVYMDLGANIIGENSQILTRGKRA